VSKALPMITDLSWAKLQAFESCQLQFDLRYNQKVHVPKDQTIYIVGATMHDALKAWTANGYKPGDLEKLAADIFIEKCRALRLRRSEKVEAWRVRVIKGAASAEAMAATLHLKDHNVDVEHRFNARLPSAPHLKLIGGYDLFDPHGLGTLFDWKFYSSYYQPDYGQLLTYAVGCRAEGKKVGRLAFLYPLLPKKYDAIKITNADIDKAEARLVSLATDARKAMPSPEPGPHCRWCEFARTRHCPATYRTRPTERNGRSYLVGMRS
jgi:hypothetical protein